MPRVAFGNASPATGLHGVIGIFARSFHPNGWGICTGDADSSGWHKGATAHGYVIVAVLSPDWYHHGRVIAHLGQGSSWTGEDALSVFGQNDAWFRGPYECVLAFEGSIDDGIPMAWGPSQMPSVFHMSVLGDQRAVAFFTFDEVMEICPSS